MRLAGLGVSGLRVWGSGSGPSQQKTINYLWPSAQVRYGHMRIVSAIDEMNGDRSR